MSGGPPELRESVPPRAADPGGRAVPLGADPLGLDPFGLERLLQALPVLAPPAAALDPQRLSAESAARVESILADELAANTKRAYRQALKLWCVWYTARYGGPLPLPVPVPVVQQFVIDFVAHDFRPAADFQQSDGTRRWGCALPANVDALLVEVGVKAAPGPWALATVETRVAALAAAHRWKQLPSPTEDAEVLRLKRALRRQYAAAGIRPRQARAVTIEEVEKMMAVCEGGLRGVRDRALIAFTFATGGRRRSEVAAATVDALERHADGTFTFELGRSKTNQTAAPRPQDRKPVLEAAADYLALWLEVSGITSGALWRRVQRARVTTPLSEAAIYEIITKRARQAGIAGAVMAHSLRAGFVTEALRLGNELFDVMDLTGHKSVQTVKRYHRPDTLAAHPAARLLK